MVTAYFAFWSVLPNFMIFAHIIVIFLTVGLTISAFRFINDVIDYTDEQLDDFRQPDKRKY